MPAPEILTERLKLTRLVAADAPALFAYRSDPEVCRYQGFEPGALADAQTFITDLADHAFDTPGTWFQFGIRLRETDELVGDFGIHFPADEPHQVEIGFTVAPGHQGRGYATEAVRGVLDHVLGPLGKHRAFASVDPRNAPSLALLERVGMRREGHFHQSVWFKGEWADDVVFGILASEWRER